MRASVRLAAYLLTTGLGVALLPTRAEAAMRFTVGFDDARPVGAKRPEMVANCINVAGWWGRYRC